MKNKFKFLITLLFISAFTVGQQQKVLSSLQEKVKKYADELSVDEPDDMDPLMLNTALVWSDDKSQLAVVIKAEILEDWRAYAYVPKTQPYVQTEIQLELPKGINKIGEWVEPSKKPYSDNIFIYKGTLVFVQYCSVGNYEKGSEVEAGLYYQTCDHYKCFPPKTKTKKIKV